MGSGVTALLYAPRLVSARSQPQPPVERRGGGSAKSVLTPPRVELLHENPSGVSSARTRTWRGRPWRPHPGHHELTPPRAPDLRYSSNASSGRKEPGARIGRIHRSRRRRDRSRSSCPRTSRRTRESLRHLRRTISAMNTWRCSKLISLYAVGSAGVLSSSLPMR